MIRALLRLGEARSQEGFLEGLVVEGEGILYVVDLHPEAKRLEFRPVELKPEVCRRYLWVGEPAASGAPRDRATASGLHYLLGSVPTALAQDPGLKPLLEGLLWDVEGRGAWRYLLDLRGFWVLGAEAGENGPFALEGGRIAYRPKDGEGKPKGKDLAEALAGLLQKALGLEGRALYTLALRGQPLVDQQAYRAYLERKLLDEVFLGGRGLCHGCGKEEEVTEDFTRLRLKFYITDKKSFAPGLKAEGFRQAFALCRACYGKLLLGERWALDRLEIPFLGGRALVLPEAELAPERLEALTERVLAEVGGLERVERWGEFLERAAARGEEVALLGFTLLLFQRSQAATKARALFPEVPPGRVGALLDAMGEEGVEGLGDWLLLLPVRREGGSYAWERVLPFVGALFRGYPLLPGEVLPLFLQTAQGLLQEDTALYAWGRLVGSPEEKALELVRLSARWLGVLRRLDLLRGEPAHSETLRSKGVGMEFAERFEAYGFGAVEAGLYLLGVAMEAVGQAQARLYEYRKEPLLESVGFLGMSLVRVRHLAAELMDRAAHYLEGGELTRVLDLLGQATDLMERGKDQAPSEREIPYYLLMGYAQARSERLRKGRTEEAARG
ncbi:TM1802 family CRISPR-associated protein [Thermus sp.]|uniref:TM1802 family CRISPR-associated protein n=1 Tax=Thermus sp. TaxID=275 RepID=UPI00307F1383